MASKSFSYFSTNTITTEKWGNRFLLNAALNHLEPFGDVEVVCDVSKNEIPDIKYSQIAKRTTHIRFIGIDSFPLSMNAFKIFSKAVNALRGVRKISIEGDNVNDLLHHQNVH